MRILYVSHLFPPRYFAGTETLTYDVAQQMRQRGHDVEVMTCESFKSGTPQVQYTQDEYDGLRVHRLHLDTRFSSNPVQSQYYHPPVEEAVRQVYRSFKPDLVHVHHFAFLTTATATVAYEMGLPLVFTPTDFWMLCPTSQLRRHDGSLCNGPTNVAKCLKCYAAAYRRVRSYNWLLQALPEPLTNWAARVMAPRFAGVLRQAQSVHMVAQRAGWNLDILRRAERILAPTRFLLERFADNGVPREKMIHLPYGLNLARLGRVERRQPQLPLQVGFVGTIAPHKGLHVLLEAFRHLGGDAPLQLSIYGNPAHDPPYGKQVKKLVAGQPGVRFCGTFASDQIGKVLSKLDVLIIPSVWYENLPLVLLSALAARLPVIVSDVGGLTELVQDGVNGLIFPVGDQQALAARLQQCVRRPGLLTELAGHGTPVKDVETYSQELVGIYTEVLSRPVALKV